MTATSPYPNLLDPITVGGVTLRNRAIMGSMHTRLESEPDGLERQARFYADRAHGGIGLIVTGGFSPSANGLLEPDGPMLTENAHADEIRPIADAVHKAGGRILVQLLHAGRYARQADCIAPSAIRSRINRYTPREMSAADIEQTIEDFTNAAALAKQAGYDGVEIMGSEGYLLNEFTVERTNKRSDNWGGSEDNRHRFPVEIVKRVRARVGDGFIIMYRISAIDLVEEGATGDDIERLAKKIEKAGADILNTGIGWHEARVPTIAYMIPRAAWRFATRRLKQTVDIPVVASNRINMPDVGEDVLSAGDADMISMARPMLADPDFMAKAAAGRPDRINTCIACNQACLDYIFAGKVATCLVNPKACYETRYSDAPAGQPKSIAVIGAGAGGLAFAAEAAERGHRVTLFEAASEIGGQINLARAVPGKQEFNEMLRYFDVRLKEAGVDIRLNSRPGEEELSDGYDEVVFATGVRPRVPDIPGIDHPKVATYVDILTGAAEAGSTVAIIGSGGIGFDVAEFLLHPDKDATNVEAFMDDWAVDRSVSHPGGLAGDPLGARPPARAITMLQRKESRPGAGLGMTTGWVHRLSLQKRNVTMLAGAAYEHIDNAGLHLTIGGEPKVIAADTIVICAGQVSNRDLHDTLTDRGVSAHLIGGADVAAELDARRAIEQGVKLAHAL